MLAERAACSSVSPHFYVLSYIQMQGYQSLRQLHFDSRDHNSGVCHVMKITIAESNPDVGFEHNKRFALTPKIWLQSLRCQLATVDHKL